MKMEQTGAMLPPAEPSKRVPVFIEETVGGIVVRAAIGSLSYWPAIMIAKGEPDFSQWRYFFKMAKEQAEYLKPRSGVAEVA